MPVNIYEWKDEISLESLGQDLKDRAGRSRLMSYVSQLLKVTPRPQVDPEPTDLQDYIKFYGEQVTKDAIGDIEG